MILSVGQLSERKGFVPLIQACRRLKDQGYDMVCHIVGKGPQYQELNDLIQELELTDTVTLCGALPHEAVIEKNDQATLFCLPCVMSKEGNLDGIPNVLPEAMAMQRPVISTTLSGIPELVDHEVNGLLVPAGDVDALVAAIARLLDDPALCQRLGKNGRQTVLEKFDIRRNIKRFAATLWPDWFQSLPARLESSVTPATAPSTFGLE
jgi:glycosyltransferase involved in cell wall biosynthesis